MAETTKAKSSGINMKGILTTAAGVAIGMLIFHVVSTQLMNKTDV